MATFIPKMTAVARLRLPDRLNRATLRPMKPRAFISSALVAALLAIITLASAPRLHERLHSTGANHECAVTLITAGSCAHTAPPQIVPTLHHAPDSPAFLPKHFQFVVGAVPLYIPAHAPP